MSRMMDGLATINSFVRTLIALVVVGGAGAAGWYGYTGALPGYNTADYHSPETGLTIMAWINYQAAEPVEQSDGVEVHRLRQPRVAVAGGRADDRR